MVLSLGSDSFSSSEDEEERKRSRQAPRRKVHSSSHREVYTNNRREVHGRRKQQSNKPSRGSKLLQEECISLYSSNFRLVHECNFSFVLLLGDRSDDRKRPDATRDRSKSAAGNCFTSVQMSKENLPALERFSDRKIMVCFYRLS